MKYFKNLLIAATLAVTTLSFSANAALISHTIFGTNVDDGNLYIIGDIAIDTQMADDWDEVQDFVSFNLLGVPQTVDALGFFEAGFDASDLYAGIQFFNFDTVWSGSPYTFSGGYDVSADPLDNTLDAFLGGNIFRFYEGVFLSEATVVSEPPMLAMLLVAASMLYMRRRKSA